MVSCQRVMSGTLARLPVQTARKVGMTSNHHGPYVLGHTRATMVGTEGSYPRGDANLQTLSQFGSQSATRLREAGIASNRISAMMR